MVTIRTAQARDAPAIAAVYVDTWRDAYAGVLPDRVLLGMSVAREAQRWRRAVAWHTETVLVAQRDAVVGLGSAGPARGDIAFEGEIYTLYVDPNHQGGGVGARLVDGLFAALLDRKLRSAVVWVVADNPARFFYQALGGRLVARRDERLWGATVRELAYGWDDLTAARQSLAARRHEMGS